MSSPRKIAVTILDRVLRLNGPTVKDLLPEYTEGGKLAKEDKALLLELTNGVLRNMYALDWHIGRHSRYRKIPLHIKNILRLGVYQLCFTDKIPAYAALNESVDLAKKKGSKNAGFVNAVLRKIADEKKEISPDDFGGDEVRFFSIKYSVPEWLVKRWKGFLSGDELAGFLGSLNSLPVLTVRVNELKIKADDLMSAFKERGILYCERENPVVMQIVSKINPGELDLFEKGYFYIQDESTVRVVDLLDPRPGDNVLDLCAAPGGKTTYISQKMKNEGRVVAVDKGGKKLKLLSGNCGRLGVVNAELIDSDIFDLDKYIKGKRFDRVLLDAPCSNQGVLAKRVEARWRLKEADIGRLSGLQKKMLEKASGYVKQGGTLVYSTCSIDNEEDEEVIRGFLEIKSDFILEKMFKTWPNSDKIDGSFAAKMTRKKNHDRS
ncbi:16S rRNA (cytosine(967)-C(5))-methyltransferase RsmB [Candidatus Auribacterota bacterium]